jgi:class 3 adenylate cyclase
MMNNGTRQPSNDSSTNDGSTNAVGVPDSGTPMERTDNFNEIFKSELDTVDHVHRVSASAITREELLMEYRLLGKRYENLIKQALKLIHISDVAQRKLTTAQQKLSEQSRIIEQTNHELHYKNDQLSESIEEINQLNIVLGTEQTKADNLLLNILPPDVAARLKQGEETIADSFDDVTVVFTDIVGFTTLSSLVSATTIMKLLNMLFSRFDALLEHYHVEKIKTTGDSYMIASGIPTPHPDHALQAASFTFAMQNALRQFVAETGYPVSMRIGMHCGPVVAGIIGTKKFVYDLWGDTVNIASRMESHGEAGRVHCSASVYEKLGHIYTFEKRGAIDVKGKGKMDTYFLIDDEPRTQ